jgi:hypothetical protein
MLMVRHLQANPSQFTLNVANTTRDKVRFEGRISEEAFAGYMNARGAKRNYASDRSVTFNPSVGSTDGP